ncbi:MAG: LL-diaminopimelate aminotransferase [Bacillota bacterium]
MIEPAQRIKDLPRYLFAEIDRLIREKVQQGVDVIRLGIGDPDLSTPAYITERAAVEVGRSHNHHYPPDEGLAEFKEAVALYYRDRLGVELDPRREVLPLIGSKEGIAHISFSFVDPGDINLVPDPGYPVYGIATRFAGGEIHRMPLTHENGFLPRFDQIPPEVLERAKLLFLNYPNNPTGAVAAPAFFQEAVDFARCHNILICHDAAYSEVMFDGARPLSLLQAAGAKAAGIEFNSLSKTFNMTGWRIGFAVGSAGALEVLGRFKTNIDSGIFKAIQYSGVEALTAPGRDRFIAGQQAIYQSRRDIVVQALRRLGWPIEPPGGSFYIWAPVPPGYSSRQFTAALLDRAGVVVTPGSGFGEYGEGYFRIALTVDESRLREAMDRIGAVVRFA